MANDSNDDRNAAGDRNAERDSNPFVAFRRYADAQFASMFNGLSDPFKSLGDAQKQLDTVQTEFLSKLERAYERATNPERRQLDDKPSTEPSRSSMSPSSSRQSPFDEVIDKLHSAFASLDRNFDRSHFPRSTLGTFDHFSAERSEEEEEERSLSFFALSPYSPLRLEQHPQLRSVGVNWRQAFEELLEADTNPFRTLPPRSPRCTWLDAMPGWQWAKLLRAEIKSEEPRTVSQYIRANHHMPWSRSPLNDWHPREKFLALSELEDHTEAAMYERFLGPASSVAARKRMMMDRESGDDFDADNDTENQDLWWCTHPSRAGFEREARGEAYPAAPPFPFDAEDDEVDDGEDIEEDEDDSKDFGAQSWPSTGFAHSTPQQPQKPSILSTMTTTDRRTMPDGSITTRTVLRRRFTDGSEEVQESNDSTPPTRVLSDAGVSALRSIGEPMASGPQDDATKDVAHGKKSGASWWNFWSN